MILFSIFSWYRPVKRTIACHWELSSTAKKKKGLSTWPSMNWLPLSFKYCRSFRVLINFINFRPHSNYFYQIIIITFIYTIQLLPIAVMPKNDRDLILWHLLKFLCVKAKRKIYILETAIWLPGSQVQVLLLLLFTLRAETTFFTIIFNAIKH